MRKPYDDWCVAATLINHAIDINKPLDKIKTNCLLYLLDKNTDFIDDDPIKSGNRVFYPVAREIFGCNYETPLTQKITHAPKFIVQNFNITLKTCPINPSKNIAARDIKRIKLLVEKYQDMAGWELSAKLF